ncbi:MAG: glycoside hydrolase family 3 C-terminal domain-containing protein [Eubacterium sp.]|nr:glycoside hydrolase family 3 C-terminal domain-containing protein [Eubacterium sp.]MCM1419041.1 glycoside hydrolase family 3 C-terminal domain-containing protein [Roseburia sp.]
MDLSPFRDRARALVKKMTLEEKCSQLRYDAPAIERLGVPAYNWWNEGLHGLARSGTATMFPQAIGLAASFDENLIERVGEITAREARARWRSASAKGDRDIYKGLTIWSPNINLFRDPRWGRGHETYGEDPFLSGLLGAAYVRGMQGDGEFMTACSCAKHFAVHSGPEALRHEFDARVSKKELRESYLPAFEALVRAGVGGVMGAYNRVDGEPACASTELMKILREEWGFEGYFVSDCWAISDFHLHHRVTESFPESAALALKKGCDVNCGCSYLHLLAAYEEGRITEEDVTRAAERLFTIRYALGMFEEDDPAPIPFTAIDSPEHNAASLAAARESMVLLKNDGLLPLQKDKIKTLAVIGCAADSREALKGNYYGTASRYTTFLEGVRAKAGDIRVLYAEGCDYIKDRSEGLALPGDRLAEAVSAAESADAVILCLGLNEHLEGEEGDAGNEYGSGDKETLLLPAPQRALLKAVLDTEKPTVVLLSAGSSVYLDDERFNALLLTWYPGAHGGTAATEILFGEVSPSGKLPVTFYRDAALLPDFTDYSLKNRTYRFLESDENVWYPFGYGLSYTRFERSIRSVEADGVGARVTVLIENRGERDGGEAILLYLSADDPLAPPNPWLCAVKRVFLKAGERREVALSVAPERFLVYDEDGEPRRAERPAFLL